MAAIGDSPNEKIERRAIAPILCPPVAMHAFREAVDSDGLVSYNADLSDSYRHVATYVDKILEGAKPDELPVEQQKKFEPVIDLKAAKQIGLTIPPNVLARGAVLS